MTRTRPAAGCWRSCSPGIGARTSPPGGASSSSCAMTDEELIDEREPLGGLVPVGEPRVEKKSLVWTFTFPTQDHKHRRGRRRRRTRPRAKGAGDVVAVDEVNRRIELKRGPKLAGTPLPDGARPASSVIPTRELPESLLRTANRSRHTAWPTLRRSDPDRRTSRRRGPCCCGRRPATTPVHRDHAGPARRPLDAAVRLAPRPRRSVSCPIQGPPGSGKTFTGAHMIVRACAGRGRGSASSPTATRSSATCSEPWTRSRGSWPGGA